MRIARTVLWTAVFVLAATLTARAADTVITVDNTDPGFAAEGEWNASTRDPGFEGENYLWHASKRRAEQAAAATWTPELAEAGAYRVEIKWVASKRDDRATNAPYTVHSAEGTHTKRVNLAEIERAGEWFSLGIFRFEKGTAGKVVLTNDAFDSVVADAVRFIRLPGVALMEGDTLFADDFSAHLGAWAWEGPPGMVVEADGGALVLDPRNWEHKGYKAINIWCRKPIHGDYAIEWDLEPLEPTPDEGKAANLLFAFDATYVDPYLDVVDFAPRRTGHYAWLTYSLKTKRYRGHYVMHRVIPPMNAYTISYYRLAKPYKLVVRKSPGFHKMVDKEIPAEQLGAGRHIARIEKRGDSFRLLQDGEELLTVTDADLAGPPLTGGYFCLRTWRAKVKVHGVKVLRLGEGD